jgi:hypothetical protein
VTRSGGFVYWFVKIKLENRKGTKRPALDLYRRLSVRMSRLVREMDANSHGMQV